MIAQKIDLPTTIAKTDAVHPSYFFYAFGK